MVQPIARRELAEGKYSNILYRLWSEQSSRNKSTRLEWLRAHADLHAPLLYELGMAEAAIIAQQYDQQLIKTRKGLRPKQRKQYKKCLKKDNQQLKTAAILDAIGKVTIPLFHAADALTRVAGKMTSDVSLQNYDGILMHTYRNYLLAFTSKHGITA